MQACDNTQVSARNILYRICQSVVIERLREPVSSVQHAVAIKGYLTHDLMYCTEFKFQEC